MENQNDLNPLKDPAAYQTTVIDLMKKFELVVGDLYNVFAEKFPESSDFWNKLFKEEQTHAYWLETLSLHSSSGKIYFNEGRFNLAPINESIEHVSGIIEKAKRGEMTLLEALAAANDTEQGMIERKYFEVFEGDSAEFKKTLFQLRKETMEHAARVSDFFNKVKGA
jgi:hypothetical protein